MEGILFSFITHCKPVFRQGPKYWYVAFICYTFCWQNEPRFTHRKRKMKIVEGICFFWRGISGINYLTSMNCFDEVVLLLEAPLQKIWQKFVWTHGPDYDSMTVTQTHHTTNLAQMVVVVSGASKQVWFCVFFLRPCNNLRADFCCNILLLPRYIMIYLSISACCQTSPTGYLSNLFNLSPESGNLSSLSPA